MRSDQEALTLHQNKTHDVGAFDASKTFHSGVSLAVISLPLEVTRHLYTVLSDGCGLG